MIDSERQLQITKEEIECFEATLEYLDHIYSSATDPRLLDIKRAAIVSKLEDLRAQVADWEKRQGK